MIETLDLDITATTREGCARDPGSISGQPSEYVALAPHMQTLLNRVRVPNSTLVLPGYGAWFTIKQPTRKGKKRSRLNGRTAMIF